jgi:hypothetical protein
MSTTITGHIGCALVGGTWIGAPTTREQCESIKRCQNPRTKQWLLHSEADCGSCRDNQWLPLFKWQPAEWKTAFLYKPQQWVNSTVIPKRIWGTMIDNTKTGGFLLEFIRFTALPLYRDYFQCLSAPIITNAVRFACDCGSPKAPSTVNCFPRTTFGAGVFVGFTGVTQTHDSPDAAITTTTDSVSAGTDSTDITIEKEEPPTSGDAGTLSEKLYDGPEHLAGHVSMGLTAESDIAYLGSDGVKLSCAAAGGCGEVKLCIKKDPEAIVPVGYKSIAFATISDAGVITKTATVVVESEDSLCGNIKTDGATTVYIAYFGGTLPSGSATFGVGLIVSIIVMIVLYL